MSLDNYPYDRSGFDPLRGAPTAHELRWQQSRQGYTLRSASAMHTLDPYITGVGMAAQQVVAGSSSPGAARRSLYGTAGGQVALDAAMMARRGGLLGYGDPVNYAANIQGGITGGGFRTSIGGTMADGRPVHGRPSLTSGQGAVAERVTLNYMKGMMTDLYGQGKTDPSKLHGFDMEEASGVFATLARRGVVGHAAHIEKNASIGKRLAAARESAIHPLVKDALAKVKLGGGSESEQEANFQKAIDAEQNEAAKKEMQAIDDNPDAVVVNTDGRKKVSRLVESVIKGMSSLSDVYGELTSPQLHRKLEEISGMRITDAGQARQAQKMVERMRGVATISDIDPRAYMQFSADLQAMLSGQVAKAGGFDARTKTMNKRVTAVMHEGMMTSSAISAKLAGMNVQQARDAGLTVGDAPTLDEIYADKAEGRLNFLSDYKGVTMAMGKVDTLTGKARKDAKALLKEFQGTTDPKRRQEIEAQMQGIWADAYSRPGQRVDFNAVLESRSAQQMIASAYDTPQKARMMDDMAAQGRANAININPMIKKLEAMGVSGKDSVGLGETIRKDLGLKGMLDLQSATSRKDRLNILADAGIKGASANKLMGQLFDRNGKPKAGFGGVAEFLSDSDWEPNMSTYERRNIAQTKLDMLGAGGSRKRLGGGGKDGVSLQGIFSAMAGGAKGLSDPESVALAIGAMADVGIGLEGVSGGPGELAGKSATGLNFEGGLNKDDLDKLAGIHGKPLDLYKKMINPRTGKKFRTQAELIKATQADPQLLLDSIQTLQSGEYANLNLSGGYQSMSAIDQEMLERVREDGTLDKRMKQGAGAAILADSMGLDDVERRKMMEDAADGGEFSTAMLEASEITEDDAGGKPWATDLKAGDGLGRIMGLSKAIAGANKGQMSSLATLNEDGSLLESMQSQYTKLEQAKEAGGGDRMVKHIGSDGKETTSSLNDLMKGLKLSMEKLKEGTAIEKGAQFVNEMIVTNVRVEGTFDPQAGE